MDFKYRRNCNPVPDSAGCEAAAAAANLGSKDLPHHHGHEQDRANEL